MITKKKYWLFLEPYSFILSNEKDALIYNSLSSFKIKVELSGEIGAIIEKLQTPENMYCIEVNDTDLNNKDVGEFINNLRNSFAGDIVESSLCTVKPTVMYPEPKLQNQVKIMDNADNPSLGKNILTYLNELTIYPTGECSIECDNCDKLFKQAVFCTKQPKELDYNVLKNFITNLGGTGINHINLVGGNILEYSKLNEMVLLLNQIPAQITYYIHYKNIYNCFESLRILKNEKNSIIILVNFPIEIDLLSSLNLRLLKEEVNYSYYFLISSENEYDEYVKICEALNLENTEIVPFFNGKNLAFFEDNVYLDTEDVDSIKVSRQEIFQRMKVNVNNFGKLTIMPDGKVYSNLNFSSIGNINQSLYELLESELKEGIAWLDTRNEKPCNECLYKKLCPSPSNYEYAIGKNNLCHVWKN